MLKQLILIIPLAILTCSSAQAGFLTSVLTGNGQADQINTINNPVGRSTLIKGQGNSGAGLQDGDILYGWIASTELTNDITTSDPFNANSPVDAIPAGTPNIINDGYIAILFSGTIQTITDGFNLLATDSSSDYSLQGLLPEFSGSGQQLDGVSNAVAAILTGDTTGGVNDLKAVWARDTNSGTNEIQDFFTDAEFDLEFAATADNGFFQSSDPFGPPGSETSFNRAGLDIIDSTLSDDYANIDFIPVPVTALLPGTGPVTFNDLALDNTIVALTTGGQGFAFTPQSSSARLNIVPEPGTLGIFSIALLGVINVRRKRS